VFGDAVAVWMVVQWGKDANKRLCRQDGTESAFGLQSDSDSWQDAGMASDLKSKKNPAAVALGRLGGLKGGPARTASMTPAQRKAAASIAAQARWSKKSKKP
jgi:hypothetical protein